MRKLFQRPVQRNEWGSAVSADGPVEWWELFDDLLFVIAANSIANRFALVFSSRFAFLEFLTVFMVLQNSWFIFIMAVSRFQDTSLLRSVLVFLYLVGTVGMANNCQLSSAQGSDSSQRFAMGFGLQVCASLCFCYDLGGYFPESFISPHVLLYFSFLSFIASFLPLSFIVALIFFHSISFLFYSFFFPFFRALSTLAFLL